MMKVEQSHKNKPEVYQYSNHISLDPEMQNFTRGETDKMHVQNSNFRCRVIIKPQNTEMYINLKCLSTIVWMILFFFPIAMQVIFISKA